LGKYPALSLLKGAEQKSKNRIDDEASILVDQATKVITQADEYPEDRGG